MSVSLMSAGSYFNDVTATAGDILSGKTANNSDGDVVTGTMPNNGAWNGTVNFGSNVAIPAGYHNGGGTVTGPRWNGDKYLYLSVQFQGGYGNPIPEHAATVVVLGDSEPGFLAHYQGGWYGKHC